MGIFRFKKFLIGYTDYMRTNRSPTPEYKSFRLARNGKKVWWLYDRQPTIALVLMAVVGFVIVFELPSEFGISYLISAAVSIVAIAAIGVMYNWFAQANDWQKLHWTDAYFGWIGFLP